MSSLTRQETGVGGSAQVVQVADTRMDLRAEKATGNTVNREMPELDWRDVNVARAMLLACGDGSETLFGVRFIEALEDDELRKLARLSFNWQMRDNVQLVDYIIALEDVTGIEHTGELNSRGRQAITLLQEGEVVDDDKEMSARIRFLLKWAFEPSTAGSAAPLVVEHTFRDRFGLDRHMFVTEMYYDAQYFNHDERTDLLTMWFDDEKDVKRLSCYRWDRDRSAFCTQTAECRCSWCSRRSLRFRNWILSAAGHRWNQLRKWGNDNKAAGQRNHVLFGSNADAWLRNHDGRSHAAKQEEYEQRWALRVHSNSMYYAGRVMRTPIRKVRTIRVSGFPADIALYEIQAIVGQVTGVIDVRRPVDAAGKPASFVEVVVPGRYGFRQFYQVLNILRSSPIVIRGHALQFLGDNETVVPEQGPAPTHRGGGATGGGGGAGSDAWTTVGGGTTGGGRTGGGARGGGRTGGGAGGFRRQ